MNKKQTNKQCSNDNIDNNNNNNNNTLFWWETGIERYSEL
jgi:hypothetical protein